MQRKTRMWLTVGSIAAVLVAALAWAAITFAGGQALDGTHWTLTQLNGQPPVAAEAVVDLSFQAEGRIGGNGGCNSYGGDYAVSGSRLTVSNLMSTLMACLDDGLNTQESAYWAALGTVASYDLSGDVLTLKDASGAAVLVFARA